ncbi:MAG: HAMP domain-containing sensor histidine kinase [Synechococcales bacterium]|nr:HAMP domain-containing sensor histidine kinase [Synechococcales bacterium]
MPSPSSEEATPTPLPSSSLPRYFQILKDESHREISLINDLLDLTRLNAQAEPLERVTIELQYWLPQCLEVFAKQAQKHQLTLIHDLPTDLPPVTIDLTHFQRILTELVTNACKYTPPGETIRITARATTLLEIRVSNSGVEIPAAERDRIFDCFYRIHNSDPWKRGGTGLGLALVKKLVNCLGGRIWVESGAGLTQFVLQLPL